MPLWRRDRHRREAPPPGAAGPPPEPAGPPPDFLPEPESEAPAEEEAHEPVEIPSEDVEPSTPPVDVEPSTPPVDEVSVTEAPPAAPGGAPYPTGEVAPSKAEEPAETGTGAEVPAVEPGQAEAPLTLAHAALDQPEDAATPEPAAAPGGETLAELRAEPPVKPAPAPAPGHRRPSHARTEAAETAFSERAQIAMERLGELPATNGAPKVRPLPRVVAIANQKGGVGKTTTTVNLGAALSELDYRVLVVDLDPQGNATSGLGIDTRNFESSMYDVIMRDAPIEDCIEPTSVQNLFVTPATIDLAGVEIELVSAFSRELKLKRAIDTVVDDFDFVLIDCPPSLGLLTINGLAAAREVMVPIQCEYYALEGLSQLIRNVQLVASNLNTGLEISAIVLTMFDARTRLAIDVADEVRSHFKEIVCRSIIPRTVRLSEAPSFGQPITVFDPGSRGAVAYRELAKEVSDGAPKRSG
jgi:chromosome partitioning protein